MSDLESLFEDETPEAGSKAPAERRRDYAFEAVAEVWGATLSELTTDQRGRINAALKQLRALDPEKDSWDLAQDIRERALMWAAVYPDAELTPQALTGSWASLPEKASKQKGRQTNAAAAPSDCSTCNGDRFVVAFIRPSLNDRSPFEEMAPCPDCNAGTVIEFWRVDGTRFRTPDAERVRELLQVQE